MVQGCVHVRVEDSNITGVFCHSPGLPANEVVHLKANKVLTNDEFLKSHQKCWNDTDMVSLATAIILSITVSWKG